MSLTEAESQAAAGVADAIVADFAKKGGYEHVPVVAESADAEAPAAAAPPTVPSTPAPAAPAAETTPATPVAPEPALEVPSFDTDIPEDLQALLDTPDFDEEAAQEIAAELENSTDDEYVDTDAAKTLRALEKRNAWLEEQVVAKSRRGWVEENLRAYPLLRTYAKDEVEKFTATSRRGFARDAAALNTRLETIAKPMLADLAQLKQDLAGEARTEARATVAASWGNVPGDTAGLTPSDQHADRLAQAEKAAMKSGSLKDVFKVMLEQKPIV